MRGQVASGYTAADTIPCYQSNVSFLPFHLSPYRSGWTVVDKQALRYSRPIWHPFLCVLHCKKIVLKIVFKPLTAADMWHLVVK
jgi:hypothetical protein